ncbi:hypothetical protein [Enterobacter mori]
MKNYHILGMVFAAGLILGAAAPAKAAPFTIIYESTLVGVDAEQCTVRTDHSDTFEVPCEDAADYRIGQHVAIVNQNGVVVVVSEDW